MDGIDLAQPLQKALSVCENCKQRKKKCDKVLPKCSSCTRFRRLCNYPDSSHSNTAMVGIGNQRTLPSQTNSLGKDLTLPSIRPMNSLSQKTSFPPAYFLDFNLSRASLQELRELPCVHSISIPPEIQQVVSTLADRRNIASDFFRGGINRSLPFLLKKTCFEKGLNPSMQSRVDVSLLFACMKLVQTPPNEDNARTPEYLALRVAFLEAELAGIMTLRLLHAWVLVAVYEVGHAIYPSAYLSIGTCARLAAALGVDAHEACGSYLPFMEVEEKRRTWWVIAILDRFVNIGCPERPLATRQLKDDDPLPIDDAAWDIGSHEFVHSFTLSSPPAFVEGQLSLLCRAASHLGIVLQYISTSKSKSNPPRLDRKDVIDQSLRSFVDTHLHELSTLDNILSSSKAICYSSLFLLHSQTPDTDDESFGTSRAIRLALSQQVLGFPTVGLDDISMMFRIENLYQAAATFTQLHIECGSVNSVTGLGDLKTTLRTINGRWQSAGEYLGLLEALAARLSTPLKQLHSSTG